MGRIEDYVEAVTRRLRPDAELHMDVSQEVRSHLEDAAAEARERGLSEGEAVEAALKAFGNEQEISDGLWSANRRRMRLRAVVKWAARVTVVPAALLLTLYLCTVSLRELDSVAPILGGAVQGTLQSALPRVFLARLGPPEIQPRADLAQEQLFVYERLHDPTPLTKAKELMERFPEDPFYYAHYVLLLSENWSVFIGDKPVDQSKLGEALSVLDRGERIEPANAFYNYLKATLLMAASSNLEEKQGIPYKYFSAREGKEAEGRGARLTIRDRATFERGIGEVYKGLSKPYYAPYAFETFRRMWELAKPPITLAEEMALYAYEAAIRLPNLALFRNMARGLPPYAALLASEGKKEDAGRLAGVMDRPGIQMGAAKDLYLIELLVARGIVITTMGQAPAIYEMLNMPEKAAQARGRFEAEVETYDSIWMNSRSEEADFQKESKYYGFISLLLAPAIPGFPYAAYGNFWRVMEHVMIERLALALLTTVLLLIALGCCAITILCLWHYRNRREGPKLLFVGWKRMALIVLLGLVLPVGFYGVYTRLAPFSSMKYGIHYQPMRIAAELCLLVSVVLFAVIFLSYRAIRARCREAGMEIPPSLPFNPLRRPGAIIRAAIGGLVVAFLGGVMWYCVYEGRRSLPLLGLSVISVLVFVLAYPWIEFRRMLRSEPKKAHFRMTVIRSLVPILAVCLVVLGLATHAYLRYTEARYIWEYHQQVPTLNAGEVEGSSLKLYRDHLHELNEKWNEEHRPQTKTFDADSR